MPLPPPPKLSATGLLWWGVALAAGGMLISWGWFAVADSGPFDAPEYSTMMDVYQYLSPVLGVLQLLGAALIAGGLNVRSMTSGREAGVDHHR